MDKSEDFIMRKKKVEKSFNDVFFEKYLSQLRQLEFDKKESKQQSGDISLETHLLSLSDMCIEQSVDELGEILHILRKTTKE
jgi:hypothetical protein